ncbi:MAG TPA: phospholipase D-like domain-containing protein, partial [Elusimicrobiota bacterium]|nr:phospholipase D-like domain-containing protein [Elusimicrobiota bacterium]
MTKPFHLKSRLGRALKVLLLGWTGFLSLSAYSGEDATLVPPGQYAAVAEREIDSARESVHLALYLFNVPPERASEPGRLLGALIRARRRGVGVEVLLDGGESPFDPEDRNRVAVESLAQGGVDAAYVDGKILHAKVLVVDRKTLLLGSSNWTTAAFRSNVEADVL